MELKQTILDYFGNDFTPFYRRYLPDLTKASASEFKALCCFHDERVPSLYCNQQTGQWYCHGCGVSGDLFEFYGQKHGLNVKTDFTKILAGISQDFGIDNGQKTKSKLGKIVATYDYTHVNGELLFQVVRYEPKDFRQRRKVNGKWVWSLKGVERVLYNLPAVTKTSEILVCEGEKDCDRLNSLGLVATTNPQGADKWQKEFTMALAGKNVTLLPHNDQPGKDHMRKVAHELYGIANTIKIIELPVDNKGGDVCDWFDAIGNDELAAERLCLMADGAKSWEPTENRKAETFSWQFEDLSEWQTVAPPPQEWVFDGLVPKQIIGGISARGGTGKTFFIQSLITGSILGTEIFRLFKPAKPCRIIALLGEDPPDETRRRFYAIGESFVEAGVTRQDLQDAFNQNLKLIAGKAAAFMQFDEKRNPEPAKLFDWLRTQVEAFRPDLIFIDPKAQFFGLQEENSNDLNTVWINALKNLTREGATVVFTHHVPKRSDPFSLDALRGGGALADACRFVLGMGPLDPKDALAVGITDPWNYAHVKITKNSYAPLDGNSYFFKRTSTGALERADIRAPQLEMLAQRTSEALKNYYTNGGKNLTRRTLTREQETKDLREEISLEGSRKIGRVLLDKVIDFGIDQGILREVESKTKGPNQHIVKFLRPGDLLI